MFFMPRFSRIKQLQLYFRIKIAYLTTMNFPKNNN